MTWSRQSGDGTCSNCPLPEAQTSAPARVCRTTAPPWAPSAPAPVSEPGLPVADSDAGAPALRSVPGPSAEHPASVNSSEAKVAALIALPEMTQLRSGINTPPHEYECIRTESYAGAGLFHSRSSLPQESVHFGVGGLERGLRVHLACRRQFQRCIQLFENHVGRACCRYFRTERRLPQVTGQRGV